MGMHVDAAIYAACADGAQPADAHEEHLPGTWLFDDRQHPSPSAHPLGRHLTTSNQLQAQHAGSDPAAGPQAPADDHQIESSEAWTGAPMMGYQIFCLGRDGFGLRGSAGSITLSVSVRGGFLDTERGLTLAGVRTGNAFGILGPYVAQVC